MAATKPSRVNLGSSASAARPIDQQWTAGAVQPVGARMETDYADQQQTLTLVDVEDLRDWKTSMREESWQFTIAGFFASGSLWLGVERLATQGIRDVLFWLCLIVLLASAVVGFFGYKQLGRRQTKIDRYIAKAEASALRASTTGGTGE